MISGNAQDILLMLNGREVPCIINKVDTFFVFYSPLGPLESIDKSMVLKVTPQKLLMKDGTEKNVVFDMAAYDFKGPYIYFREKGKTEKRVDRYNYFSCTTNSFDTLLPFQDTIYLKKNEKVLYAQDSLHRKFELTIDEQRAFTYGRRSARKNFSSPWSTIGGIASGFAGGVVLNFFYAAAPAVVFCTVNGSIQPKMGKTGLEDEAYKNEEYFIAGYRSQAQKLKVKNSILGAVPALAVGILLKFFSSQ